MCRWENENWPIHLPKLDSNLDPKLDPYICRRSKLAPILRNLCKMSVKFANIWEIFFENFTKIGYWKKWRPIYLPKFRFEKGSFIYQSGKNGTQFRGTSPIPLVTWVPPSSPGKTSAYEKHGVLYLLFLFFLFFLQANPSRTVTSIHVCFVFKIVPPPFLLSNWFTCKGIVS